MGANGGGAAAAIAESIADERLNVADRPGRRSVKKAVAFGVDRHDAADAIGFDVVITRFVVVPGATRSSASTSSELLLSLDCG